MLWLIQLKIKCYTELFICYPMQYFTSVWYVKQLPGYQQQKILVIFVICWPIFSINVWYIYQTFINLWIENKRKRKKIHCPISKPYHWEVFSSQKSETKTKAFKVQDRIVHQQQICHTSLTLWCILFDSIALIQSNSRMLTITGILVFSGFMFLVVFLQALLNTFFAVGSWPTDLRGRGHCHWGEGMCFIHCLDGSN